MVRPVSDIYVIKFKELLEKYELDLCLKGENTKIMKKKDYQNWLNKSYDKELEKKQKK